MPKPPPRHPKKAYCVFLKTVQTEHGRVSSEKVGSEEGEGLVDRQNGVRPSARRFLHTRELNTDVGPTQESCKICLAMSSYQEGT